MKNKYARFLQAVLVTFGVGLLVFAIFALPHYATLAALHYTELAYLKVPIMIFVYISAVPFYIALIEGVRICSTIINNNPFSTGNLKSFNVAAVCALVVSVMYFSGTGIMAFLNVERIIVYTVGIIIGACGLIVALMCMILNLLLKKAIELREENDLTV